jgi:hypothetical protein
MNRTSVVEHYLQRYAEPEIALAAGVTGLFEQVLVVPCYSEAEDFLSRMAVPGGPRTLTIIVVNAPDNAANETLSSNQALLSSLRRQANPWQLIIDRVSVPLPHRQGVGLARKIGADVALALIAAGRVARPWIYFSDADARLPADYFAAEPPGTGSLLFGFRHRSDNPQLQRRATLYELHLRYYAWQLRQAGSTYAFVTLGSTMAVAAASYAAVRGVPRRNAAEDFYLFNKLAKIAPVTVLTEPVVELTARLSDRVPFGTGPALRRMAEDSEAYLSYAPEVFTLLAETLASLHQYAADGNDPPLRQPAVRALNELGWPTIQATLARLAARQQRHRALREWFDGFRTMRFVRLLAAEYPAVSLLQSLRRLLSADPDCPATELLQQLIEAEKPVTISPTD